MLDVRNVLVAVVLFVSVVPLLVLPWIRRQYARHGRLAGATALAAAVEVLYVCGLAAFTLFPLPTETAAYCAGRDVDDYLNLDPVNVLAGGVPAAVQIAANLVLFLPLGFFARWRYGRSLLAASVIGLGVSLAVEVTQGTAVFGAYRCPYRVADVGDLMINTLGAVLGWLAAHAARGVLPASAGPRSPDLDRPGLLRRGLAAAADWLIGFLGTLLVLEGLLVAGLPRGGTPPVWAAAGLAVFAVTTVVIPLVRRDRATPGQVTFALAVDHERSGRAILLRFLVWWLPVALLTAVGNAGWAVVAAVVIGLVARSRPDRRTVLEAVSGARVMTRSAWESCHQR